MTGEIGQKLPTVKFARQKKKLVLTGVPDRIRGSLPTIHPATRKNAYKYKNKSRPELPPRFETQKAIASRAPVPSRAIEM